MIRILSTFLRFELRTIKARNQAKVEQKPKEKLKFTDRELTQMGMYNRAPKRTNIVQTIQAKITEKQNQSKMKKNIETNQQEEQKPSASYEMKTKKDIKQKFKTFKIYNRLKKPKIGKEKAQQQKTEESKEQMTLRQFSKVRMEPLYLPIEYMQKVQKIFHKYNQTQLREIALHFNKLVKLRYHEQKIDYELYPNLKFQKLQEQLPIHRQVQQIYLIGKDKIYEERAEPLKKVDEEALDVEMNYTQNITISYLLNRVPRTFATAQRIFNQIKKKYPSFEPESLIDFGSGLSSGSCAFIQTYGDKQSIYNIEPAGKMRKLSKYLTSHTPIQHFESLSQLYSRINQADIVYAGYVLNQLKPELVQTYLESLWIKTKPQGFLVLVEYGNPFGARLIHESRKWALTKKSTIAAPCPHQMKCPLAKQKFWCHFDQPSGMYPREVFGKLPTDNQVKNEKFSYLIIQKLENDSNTSILSEPIIKIQPNITNDWDRILFPLIRRGQHFVKTLCTKSGQFEKRVSAKSHGFEYKEGRKLNWGDLWRFGSRIPNKYRKERRTGKRLW